MAAHMTFELWALLVASTLGLVHLTAASFTYKAQVGNAYSVGPRDEEIPRTGMAGRMQRAQANFLETFPIFVAVTLMVFVTGSAGSFSYWGCLLYLFGRILFLPLYASGIPWLRTFSWNFATLGLVLSGVELMV